MNNKIWFLAAFSLFFSMGMDCSRGKVISYASGGLIQGARVDLAQFPHLSQPVGGPWQGFFYPYSTVASTTGSSHEYNYGFHQPSSCLSSVQNYNILVNQDDGQWWRRKVTRSGYDPVIQYQYVQNKDVVSCDTYDCNSNQTVPGTCVNFHTDTMFAIGLSEYSGYERFLPDLIPDERDTRPELDCVWETQADFDIGEDPAVVAIRYGTTAANVGSGEFRIETATAGTSCFTQNGGSDDLCPQGLECGTGGNCQFKTCQSGSDCPAWLDCVSDKCSNPVCTSDANCSTDECVFPGVCAFERPFIPTISCQDNFGCTTNYCNTSGECDLRPCSSDADCAGSFYNTCWVDEGVCVDTPDECSSSDSSFCDCQLESSGTCKPEAYQLTVGLSTGGGSHLTQRLEVPGAEFDTDPAHEHVHLQGVFQTNVYREFASLLCSGSFCQTCGTPFTPPCPPCESKDDPACSVDFSGSNKLGFCLLNGGSFDNEIKSNFSYGETATGSTCGRAVQQIQAGWLDRYPENITGQSIIVGHQGLGTTAYHNRIAKYSNKSVWIETHLNPDEIVHERNYDNNVTRTKFPFPIMTSSFAFCQDSNNDVNIRICEDESAPGPEFDRCADYEPYF